MRKGNRESQKKEGRHRGRETEERLAARRERCDMAKRGPSVTPPPSNIISLVGFLELRVSPISFYF